MEPEEQERLQLQQQMLGQKAMLPISNQGVDMTMTLPNVPVNAVPLGQQPTQTQTEVPSVQLLGQGAQAIAQPTQSDLAPTQAVQDMMPVPMTNVGLTGQPLPDVYRPNTPRGDNSTRPYGFLDTLKAAGSGVIQGLQDLVSDPQGTIEDRVQQPITNVLATAYNASEGAAPGSLPDRFRGAIDNFDPRQTPLAKIGEFLTGSDISDPTPGTTQPAPTARVQELISQGLIDPSTGEATAAGESATRPTPQANSIFGQQFSDTTATPLAAIQGIDLNAPVQSAPEGMVRTIDPNTGQPIFADKETAARFADVINARRQADFAAQQSAIQQLAGSDVGFQRMASTPSGGFAAASDALQAAQAARPDFTKTVSNRERRGGAEMSAAEARDLAKGLEKRATVDEKARALLIQGRYGIGDFKPDRSESEEDYLRRRTELIDAQIANAQKEEPTKTAQISKEIDAINARRANMNPPEPPLTPDEERMIFLEGIGARGTASVIQPDSVDVVMGNTETKEDSGFKIVQ